MAIMAEETINVEFKESGVQTLDSYSGNKNTDDKKTATATKMQELKLYNIWQQGWFT